MLIWILEDEFHADTIGEFPTFDEAETELNKRLSLPRSHQVNCGPCSNPDCPRQYHIIEYDNSTTPWTEITKTRIFIPD